MTQALKRSPINFRRLALIPKTQNAKGIALFLSTYVKLRRAGTGGHDDQVQPLLERLIALRAQDNPYWCWGYSFPWQTRTMIVPSAAPNLVCTTFAANALLDVYEDCRDSECLKMAVSAAEYLTEELYWSEGSAAGFGYPLRSLRNQVHNANFLAAALLARVYRHTGERKFLDPALSAARCSASKQHADGSWQYGESASQGWIDNFHTGYNLCALQRIARDAATAEFDPCIRRGYTFYRAHFFRGDGAVRYFHNRTYPIDIHCVAQAIITLLAFHNLDPDNFATASSVFQWTMKHLWDDEGFFYYRALRLCTIRTSYMRWSQAWMALAIASLLCEPRSDATTAV